MSRWACDGSRRWMLPTRGRAASPALRDDDVEPGAEVVAGGGDHDDAHGLVAAGGVDRVDHPGHHLVGERVALVGTIQVQAQHAVVVR